MDPDLTPMQQDIMEMLLIDGAGSPTSLSQLLPNRRPSISNALSDLEDLDLVYNKGGGVYALTPEGVTVIRVLLRSDET
jgi:Mn-dependent DtxR family transcriptional regulator